MTEDQGRQLAQELGIKFMETSAKVNEGVEDAFFSLARYAHCTSDCPTVQRPNSASNICVIGTSKHGSSILDLSNWQLVRLPMPMSTLLRAPPLLPLPHAANILLADNPWFSNDGQQTSICGRRLFFC